MEMILEIKNGKDLTVNGFLFVWNVELRDPPWKWGLNLFFLMCGEGAFSSSFTVLQSMRNGRIVGKLSKTRGRGERFHALVELQSDPSRKLGPTKSDLGQLDPAFKPISNLLVWTRRIPFHLDPDMKTHFCESDSSKLIALILKNLAKS